MKYRLTPLNIASLILIGFSLYTIIFTGGWGVLLCLYYIIPIGISGLLFDFLVQKLSQKYRWTFIIEISLLAVLFICYSYTRRTITLIIPDHLQNKYIVTIYGVDNAQRLPKGPLPWNHEVTVPANGILLTSSDLDGNLPVEKMKTYSGTEIKMMSAKNKFGWLIYIYENNKFKCNEKTYSYKVWLVDSSYVSPTSNLEDSLKSYIKEQFCKH